MNPILTERDLLQALFRVDVINPGAVKALDERLNDMGYRVDWAPWTTQSKFWEYDKPLIFKVLDKDNELPLDKDFNWKQHAPLDNIISNTKNQQETQTKLRVRRLLRTLTPMTTLIVRRF